MKKVIFLIVMVFGLMFESKATDLLAIADSTKQFVTELKDSAVQTVKEIDTSSTFKQMYSDFKQGVVALASSLKVGAEHIYIVLVRQQIVYGIVYLILLLIGIFLMINWLRNYKNSGEIWWQRNDATLLGIFRTIQIIVALIMMVIGIVNIETIVTGVVNPEYGAIKEVVKMVKEVHK